MNFGLPKDIEPVPVDANRMQLAKELMTTALRRSLAAVGSYAIAGFNAYAAIEYHNTFAIANAVAVGIGAYMGYRQEQGAKTQAHLAAHYYHEALLYGVDSSLEE